MSKEYKLVCDTVLNKLRAYPELTNLLDGITTDTVRLLSPGSTHPAALALVAEKLEWEQKHKAPRNFEQYARPIYVLDAFHGFAVQTNHFFEKFVGYLKKKGTTEGSIIEWGAGSGAGTALLALLLKKHIPNGNFTVYYENIVDTMQFKFAEELFKELGLSIRMVDRNLLPSGQQFDMALCSEYLEHFEEPVTELAYILSWHPSTVALASSFNNSAIGHFTDEYKLAGLPITNRSVSKHLRELLEKGYYFQTEIKIWNGKPAVWIAK